MADEASTEICLCSAYSVVYVLDGQDWKVTGKEGWTQVHVYKDTQDGSHRIIGWAVVGLQLVINANVTPLCKYKQKTEDFHQFTDEENNKFGFGFYKQKDSFYEESHKFKSIIMSVLGLGGGGQIESKQPEPQQPEMPLGHGPPVQEDLSKHLHLALGDMSIQKAMGWFGGGGYKKGVSSTKKGISGPMSVTHNNHVKYNSTTRTYEGLPKEWEPLLKRQFGLDPKHIQCVAVEGYVSKIPQVLLTMRDYLRQERAMELEGLFRIAADADECVYIKKSMNEGAFTRCEDVHCIANLLKVWFRDLPRALLDPGLTADVNACQHEQDAADIIAQLPEPALSLYLWLVDLCVEVQSYSDVNKMTGKNLAIVIGPNLFNPCMEDPMETLRYSQKVANFLHKSIAWRLTHRPPPPRCPPVYYP